MLLDKIKCCDNRIIHVSVSKHLDLNAFIFKYTLMDSHTLELMVTAELLEEAPVNALFNMQIYPRIKQDIYYHYYPEKKPESVPGLFQIMDQQPVIPKFMEDILDATEKIVAKNILGYITAPPAIFADFSTEEKGLTHAQIKANALAKAYGHNPDTTKKNSISNVPKEISEAVPGLSSWQKCPNKDCTSNAPLFRLIQHINDTHGPKNGGIWDRLAIADWLESLDVDLEFKVGG